MNPYQKTVAKINQLPEPLLQEVNKFIDSLLLKQKQTVFSSLISDQPTSQNVDPLDFMQIAETGFLEWNDLEEDIYNDETPT
jgi:hypothetical protein